jgi:protein ImuB
MICCLVSESPKGDARLIEIARACSPRVESHSERVVVFDAHGLDRVIGSPAEIAQAVDALACEQGMRVRVALAPTRIAAWLLAHTRSGITVVDPATMRKTVGGLPVTALSIVPRSIATGLRHAEGQRRRRHDQQEATVSTLMRWGLHTLDEVAALPRADVHTRLGAEGVRLHQAACGEDADPLVPAGEVPPFLERCVLEWPIEGLEPLTFVLSRLCEALSLSLERADRGAIRVTTTLALVTRATHARTLNLPAPMRDARTLRTLIRLDLESHPPSAAIDVVTVSVEVEPGRIVQGSLLDRSLPAPELVATLVARLRALMGESRVGAPVVLNSHDDRGAGLQPFAVTETAPRRLPSGDATPVIRAPQSALRRFRLPIAARVTVERGAPVRVATGSPVIPAARVVHRAGPWRSSGRWWATDQVWDRDEWDVELDGGGCYRLARNRHTGNWEIEGEID